MSFFSQRKRTAKQKSLLLRVVWVYDLVVANFEPPERKTLMLLFDFLINYLKQSLCGHLFL